MGGWRRGCGSGRRGRGADGPPPAGPGEDVIGLPEPVPDEPEQEPPHLGHGQRDEPGSAFFSAGGGPPLAGPDHGEDGRGEQREGDVSVPAGPRPHLVLVEPAAALGQREALLDRPPRPRDPDQLRERRRRRPAAEEVRDLRRIGRAAADQPPPGVRLRVRAVRRDGRPAVEPGPLRAVPAAQPPPAADRNLGEQGLRPDLPQAGPDGLVGPHAEHVAEPAVLDRLAEPVVRAVDGVGRRPGRRDAGVDGPLDRPPRQADLRREPDRLRHPGGRPPVGALGPLPAVLPPGVPEQGPDVADRPPPRLAAGEPAADQAGDRRQLPRPGFDPPRLRQRRPRRHRPASLEHPIPRRFYQLRL